MTKLSFREATVSDIPQIQIVRNSVKENTLSNPTLVTDQDCEEYITKRGKGWICENENQIVGFAIADLVQDNIWALFVRPDFEKRGIGKTLHKMMLDWYFSHDKEYVWLGTAPGTRAEKFYKSSGWKHVGNNGEKEIKFIMTRNDWNADGHSN